MKSRVVVIGQWGAGLRIGFLVPPPFLLLLGWNLILVASDVIKPNVETTLQKKK